MTERYSSVAQAEAEAALGKVVSLADYRGLLRAGGRSGVTGSASVYSMEPRRASKERRP